MRTFQRICTLLAVLATTLGSATAADFFATPDGAGKKDGSTWENAVEQAAISKTFNQTMQPGDHLFLGSGTYREMSLTIGSSGIEGKPKTMTGIDRGTGLPVFASDWTIAAPTKGKNAVFINEAISHLVFEHLRIRGYVMGVYNHPAKLPGGSSHLTFRDVDVEQVRHGFYLHDCDDLRLVDCEVKRYSKHGFRFDAGCNRVSVEKCTADCSEGDPEWEKKTELFPFGFNVNDGGTPNTNLTFTDCLARNNLMPLQTGRYKNGDGFVMENNTVGVSLIRCRSIRNQDGGFDLKVHDVKLQDCVALGNSRNYRIWSTATLTNCLAGWGGTGLWCNGGPLTVDHCTFHSLRVAAVMTDDHATAPVTLRDCLISASPPTRKTARGEIVLGNTVLADATDPKKDAAFLRPDEKWDGLGDAMNSRTFPGQGYRAPSTSH